MRVGIFTYGMDERMTGIARYTVELTRALRRLEPSLDIVLLTPYPDSAHPWYGEFACYPSPALKRLPLAASAGNWLLHRAALRLDLDILHDPCGIAPFLVRGGRYKRVTTVHDAVPYLYPETQPLLTRMVFQTLVRAARLTADAVCTVSESAANDLVRYAGIPRAKLFVTPNGTDAPPVLSPATRHHVLSGLGVRAPYFLYVGALHPRKNLERVVQAFALLQAEGVKAQLVIVGPPSWGAAGTLRPLLERARDDASVLLTGFVSDEVLHALYGGARALVFPSLYEGFGLPALEAMAHGTPVIGSNRGALPEVIGEAGLLVDPLAPEAIAGAMRHLLSNDDLYRVLSVRGRARARLFTWQDTAQRTLAVYRHLMHGAEGLGATRACDHAQAPGL